MNLFRSYKKAVIGLTSVTISVLIYVMLFFLTHQHIEFRNNSGIVSGWVVRDFIHPKYYSVIDAFYSRARELLNVYPAQEVE
jgi:hypothetical protein